MRIRSMTCFDVWLSVCLFVCCSCHVPQELTDSDYEWVTSESLTVAQVRILFVFIMKNDGSNKKSDGFSTDSY